MDLVLWRHAQADGLAEGGDDLARALTGRPLLVAVLPPELA